MQRQLLRLNDVRRIVGLSKSEIYRRIALKQFPASVPLGGRARAWDSVEIWQYVEERIAARDAPSAKDRRVALMLQARKRKVVQSA